jgi:CspA family cold shock protein
MGRYKDYNRDAKRASSDEEQGSGPSLGNQPGQGSRSQTPVEASPHQRSEIPRSQVTGRVTESVGTVTLYKADKGFGFVKQDDGGKDVFVHATALDRAGLRALVEGQRVRMQVGQGKKGLEVQTIELL